MRHFTLLSAALMLSMSLISHAKADEFGARFQNQGPTALSDEPFMADLLNIEPAAGGDMQDADPSAAAEDAQAPESSPNDAAAPKAQDKN